MCDDFPRYGRIPREQVRVRYYRLAVLFMIIVLILMAYNHDVNQDLVDQPTPAEREKKTQQERDESAALALFEIPSKRGAK